MSIQLFRRLLCSSAMLAVTLLPNVARCEDGATATIVLPSFSGVQSSGSTSLHLMAGKGVLVSTTDSLKRIAISDPAVADALVVSPHQVLISAHAAGEASLVMWDSAERSRNLDIIIDLDSSALSAALDELYGAGAIKVSQVRNSLVLSGHVNRKEDADRAAALASEYSKNVVNSLNIGVPDDQQVMLEVKFAEVDRAALLQLGVNLFTLGRGNTVAATTTQQFGSQNLSSTSSNAFQIGSLLNLFLFRTDIGVGTEIQALQQKNIVQILAEPNLVALNNKEADFLAGGEYPIPVVQGGGNSNAVTVLFKEYGVKLKFVPSITPDGSIRLHVAPEVSALDFANGVSLSGFTVPGLTTRRAETEVELKDGQTFVLAGLLDNRLTNNLSKVPGAANIPILGLLFKSKNFQNSRTELMVIVTAHRIPATGKQPELPTFPQPFLSPLPKAAPKKDGSQ